MRANAELERLYREVGRAGLEALDLGDWPRSASLLEHCVSLPDGSLAPRRFERGEEVVACNALLGRDPAHVALLTLAQRTFKDALQEARERCLSPESGAAFANRCVALVRARAVARRRRGVQRVPPPSSPPASAPRGPPSPRTSSTTPSARSSAASSSPSPCPPCACGSTATACARDGALSLFPRRRRGGGSRARIPPDKKERRRVRRTQRRVSAPSRAFASHRGARPRRPRSRPAPRTSSTSPSAASSAPSSRDRVGVGVVRGHRSLARREAPRGPRPERVGRRAEAEPGGWRMGELPAASVTGRGDLEPAAGLGEVLEIDEVRSRWKSSGGWRSTTSWRRCA